MAVKYGIWIALTTNVLMLCGIIPLGEFLAVVGGKVCHAYSSIRTPHVFQRKILFSKEALICDNKIVRIIPNINRPYRNMLLSKYSVSLINIKVGKINNLIWSQFVDSEYSTLRITCIFVEYCVFCVCSAATWHNKRYIIILGLYVLKCCVSVFINSMPYNDQSVQEPVYIF